MLAASRRAFRPQFLRTAARRQLSSGSHSDFARQTKVETSEADGVEEFIRNTVEKNPVTLFMKGTPEYPQCGFSQQVRPKFICSRFTSPRKAGRHFVSQ